MIYATVMLNLTLTVGNVNESLLISTSSTNDNRYPDFVPRSRSGAVPPTLKAILLFFVLTFSCNVSTKILKQYYNNIAITDGGTAPGQVSGQEIQPALYHLNMPEFTVGPEHWY